MSAATNILEFSEVTLPKASPEQSEMRQLNFKLAGGRLLLLKLETGNEDLPLADAAEGLVAPAAGFIRWRERAWPKLAPHDELHARSQIGRVFEKQGWLSNLNVIENVTLSQRHHTRRPESDIIAEADALARYFGLAETPRPRPAFVSRRDLKIAEWVRAFMATPLLLLLERPEAGVTDDKLPKLIDAVQAALRRGAAVVWQTDRPAVWNALIWKDEIRYRMQGADMILAKDKQP